MSEHKSGFVNIIGNPNVGKSTLMNSLVGEKLSIITSKAQTTRHRILGIVNSEDFQLVFSDTPGIIKPAYKMHEGMMDFVKAALTDADVILYVTEVGEKTIKDEALLERIAKTSIPVLLLCNKVDTATQESLDEHMTHWKSVLPNADTLAVSALEKFNLEEVLQWILARIPECPPYYGKDEMTDKPERFFVSEIIREKIFINYKKEIPYSCEVVVETFEEAEDIIRIRAVIMVARESQKGILIGHRGAKLKTVGTQARKDMEAFFDKKIFLETYVKVNKDWRDDDRQLKQFGYLN